MSHIGNIVGSINPVVEWSREDVGTHYKIRRYRSNQGGFCGYIPKAGSIKSQLLREHGYRYASEVLIGRIRKRTIIDIKKAVPVTFPPLIFLHPFKFNRSRQIRQIEELRGYIW
ncbi:hypothetical protein KQX54_019243 [Cotesia glomerata]|uniref:Uncharacterized protein n=1 Tax=Cotesia glomerata TaxID=32391 RepID=A0AAV7I7Z1_COTGL|nr:hypothetical protein KQX54_019243 [Cotesia glomerata]